MGQSNSKDVSFELIVSKFPYLGVFLLYLNPLNTNFQKWGLTWGLS